MILAPADSSSDTDNSTPFNYGFIWRISLVAAMGGLLFGYDWVVIGGAKPFFEKYFQLTNAEMVGWANSCALLGCLLGSLISGGLSDKFGRKKLLILAAVLFAVSSVFTGWAFSFNAFVFWRIIGGVAIGMASNLSPMYIAEVAPARMRGQLVSINQLTIVIGILIAQVANLLIAERVEDTATAEAIRLSWNGQFGWRWMFTAVTLPSLVFLVGAICIPESPRWLIKNGMADKARDILKRIGGEDYANRETQSVISTISEEEIQHVRFRDLLEPKMLRILLIGCTLAVLQQWSGINVIFSYAEEIFRAAGYGVSSILVNIVITGVVMLVFTLIAIKTVDRFGRRILMTVGCAGIAIFHFLIGCAYHFHFTGLSVVIPVLATIACYSFSLAPVTWVLISEIFPNRIRGAAVSVAVSSLWIACFILTYTFPAMNEALGPAMTFWLYSAICAAGFVFILLRVPETKGKTLEQIEKELVD
ncbi:sugar porter family MFS transporter [Luteolibacter arcticus]|uniref:Sugar porter family MFS transporter n=1 Tax=Luteolibacter arcticus TaxID=1581411 RepID=A0ABT3GK71_9BACT|nr:sugar porter family MFS transporter [Luteolibacter arcticus]MCW1923914.1 sugar porter family MFS transporter [Luteolibacter arcticus]